LGVLLGTFMGGMCLGSILVPRFVSSQLHPLRIYAALELAIGVCGLAVLYGVPHLDTVYAALAGDGFRGLVLRGVLAAACLLPPTVLMGATLPVAARWVEATPAGVSWLGFFYGGNIAGAVLGCLLAGFYLLRVHDMAVATYVAAALNVAVALLGFGVGLVTVHAPAADNRKAPSRETASGSWTVYVAIALSGACALGAEVIWTRLLSLALGPTVYTFSIILAVFLIGLGIGSSLGSLLARDPAWSRVALGSCQLLLAPAIAWTAYLIAFSLPYWPIDHGSATRPRILFEIDLVRCLWALLPPACLWGASFPLALASVAGPGQDPARLVSAVYAANTVGAIFGALGASLLIVPWAGTQVAQKTLIALSTAAALLVFAPPLGVFGDAAPAGRPRWGYGLAVIGAAGLALALGQLLPAAPWELIAYGRAIPAYEGHWSMLYVGEGINSSVAVTETGSGVKNFHVSGKIEASSEPSDMRLQRMLGHLAGLIHGQPRSVLIVGCGAGVTSGSFVPYPDTERIVICEIEPLIPRVVATYFADENHHVLNDPRLRIEYDDARHFILRTPDKFDIITSDPIHPWVKGSAALYTREYFELCKRRLNPGGVITQWVPLYESSFDVVKSEIATFFEVFPNGTIWSNDHLGEGYDVVLLAQVEPTRIDADELQERLELPDRMAVAHSLKGVGFSSALSLLQSYAGQASDLHEWLQHAEINRDRNLRLQYLAGLGVNAKQGDAIYKDMLRYRMFPDNLFIGTGTRSRALRSLLARTPGAP
jgi:spermidine synthase